MTDRIHALTVILSREIRDDDAQPLIDAIRMLKGVADVSAHISDPGVHFAELRIRTEIERQLWEVLHPKGQA